MEQTEGAREDGLGGRGRGRDSGRGERQGVQGWVGERKTERETGIKEQKEEEGKEGE